MKTLKNIKEFYQFKESIKNNNNILLVGIDVSKQHSDLCITDTSSNILFKNYRFQNTNEGFNNMIDRVNIIKAKNHKQDIFFGLEPTGRYHKTLATFILKKELPVCQISTVIARDNRRSLDGSWRKNDIKDALNISDLMQRGRVLFYPLPDNFYDGLRELISFRYKLSKHLTGLRIMLKNSFFSVYFPELENMYDNMAHPDVLQILNKFPTAKHIRKIPLNKFIKNFDKSTSKSNQKIKEVWENAQCSIGCEPNVATNILAKQIVDHVIFYQRNLSEIDKKIANLCKQHIDYDLLQTLPGFGPIHSATFMACVKNIDNYKNIKQMKKLAGIDLEYSQSGKYKGNMCISKKGNSLLRYTLCSAATRALNNKVFKKTFEEKLKNKGVSRDNKAKLQIKCAEKLLRIAYAVLKTKKPFDLEMINQYSVKQPV